MASYRGGNYLRAARLFRSAYNTIRDDTGMKRHRMKMYGQELLDNTGLSYYKAGMYDSGLQYLLQAQLFVSSNIRAEDNQTDLLEARSVIEGNLADLYAAINKKDSAEFYFRSAILTNRLINRNIRDREFNQVKLAALLIEKGNITEAKDLLNEATNGSGLLKSHNRFEDSLELVYRVSKVYSDYFRSTGDFRNALLMLEQHHNLQKRKWLLNSKKQMNPVDYGIDNAWHEKQILDLEKDKHIRALQITILVLICVIGVSISYHFHRRKIQKIKKLENDNERIISTNSVVQRELEQKNAEDRLNYLALLENTDACLWSVDTNLKLLAFNNRYVEYVQSVTGKVPLVGNIDMMGEFSEAFHNKVSEGFNLAFAGSITQLLDKGLDVDGRETDIALVFKPVFNHQKKVVAVSCSRRDISQFTRLKQSLEHNDEQFKNIAWLQSHKLRGPLSTALGISYLLNDRAVELTEKNKTELLDGLGKRLEELDGIIVEIVNQTYLHKQDS